MTDDTFSTTDAALLLGVSLRTIQDWIKRGQFPNAYKLNPILGRNSPYRIPCTDIDAFKSRRCRAGISVAAAHVGDPCH